MSAPSVSTFRKSIDSIPCSVIYSSPTTIGAVSVVSSRCPGGATVVFSKELFGSRYTVRGARAAPEPDRVDVHRWRVFEAPRESRRSRGNDLETVDLSARLRVEQHRRPCALICTDIECRDHTVRRQRVEHALFAVRRVHVVVVSVCPEKGSRGIGRERDAPVISARGDSSVDPRFHSPHCQPRHRSARRALVLVLHLVVTARRCLTTEYLIPRADWRKARHTNQPSCLAR